MVIQRVADAVMELFIDVTILSRATRSLNSNSPSADHELKMVKLICQEVCLFHCYLAYNLPVVCNWYEYGYEVHRTSLWSHVLPIGSWEDHALVERCAKRGTPQAVHDTVRAEPRRLRQRWCRRTARTRLLGLPLFESLCWPRNKLNS